MSSWCFSAFCDWRLCPFSSRLLASVRTAWVQTTLEPGSFLHAFPPTTSKWPYGVVKVIFANVQEERKTTRCSSSCCSFSHLPRRQRIAFLVMVPSGLLTREQPQNSHDPCREQPGRICARWETDNWKPGSTYRTSHLYHRPTAFRATRTGRLCGKKALNKKPAAASLHADGLRKNLAIIIAGFSGLVKCPTSPFCAGCIPTFWVTLLRPLAGE